MKQEIGSMKEQTGEKVTDFDVVFTALYNLIFEKLQTEPGKGIIVCKGLPNQRRVKWEKAMKMAHTLEDICRENGIK